MGRRSSPCPSSVEFDPDAGCYRATFDPREHRPSEALVAAAAAVLGIDRTELDPLFDAVDPEALDALLGRPPVGAGSPPTAAFSYHGFRVEVSAEGTVELRRERPR